MGTYHVKLRLRSPPKRWKNYCSDSTGSVEFFIYLFLLFMFENSSQRKEIGTLIPTTKKGRAENIVFYI